MRHRTSGQPYFNVLAIAIISITAPTAGRAQSPSKELLESESRRIATIDKVRPSVVAIFAPGGQGGGSGVLISDDGFALSNYHVVAGSGATMNCGLSDGVLYDAVLVGLDKVGDVALIKLLPQKPGAKFPFAKMADSDKVHVGDWALALGNPFLLATDFTPTVTFGLISGVHRYQYPESQRGLLEYTDCIQTDTSINPGNSGGPLFNMDGELIGINGRISLQKRERLNSGVGYAISINQIKNFLGHLKAGMDTDHASTGFTVESESENVAGARMLVRTILEDSDAHRRGIEPDDEIVSFSGRFMTSVNQYKNVLGIYPKGWRLPLVYRRNNEKHEVLIRLRGLQRAESDEMPMPDRFQPDPDQPPRPGPGEPRPRPGQPRPTQPKPAPEAKDSPALKFFEKKAGYANYYFNKLERDRLLQSFKKQGDFAGVAGAWTIEGEMELKQQKVPCQIRIEEVKGKDGKDTHTIVRLTMGGVKYELDPLKDGQGLAILKDPPNSGGLLLALYQYRRLLTAGEKGFEAGFHHGGHEPIYPSAVGAQAKSYQDLRVDSEVLLTEHAAIPSKWFFSLTDQRMLGMEAQVDPHDDPCELYMSDYKPIDGRALPHRLEIRFGNYRFGVLTVKTYKLEASPAPEPKK